MKYILLIIICFILFSTHILEAQVPGYQGKRFMAGYNAYIVPNYQKILGDETFNKNFINLRHNFNAEYIIGRRLVLGADLEISKINYSYDEIDFSYDSRYYNSNYETGIKNTDVSSVLYGIHFTSYSMNNNPVAPIGDYFRFRFFKLNYSTGIPDIEEYLNSVKTPIIKSYSTYGIGLGYGQTRVFYNKAVLDIGVEANWLTGNSGFTPNNKNNGLSFSENESLRVLFWNYMVGFKIGVSGIFF